MSNGILNSNSHFSQAPQVSVSRSRFNRPSRLTTTANAGDLFVTYVDEVLPGDSFDMKQRSLVRMSTPLFPVMDDAYFDTYYFFVPNRLLWNHWKEFMGENTTGPWTQTKEYNIPMITYSPDENNGQKPCTGTLWDYFGLPAAGSCATNDNARTSHQVNALPFRAYVLIWNEFFRDENIDNPAYFYDGDSNLEFKLRQNFGTDGIDDPLKFKATLSLEDKLQCALLGGYPLPVNKFHDYFTSCLPQPQKGEPIDIFNSIASTPLPVYTSKSQSLFYTDMPDFSTKMEMYPGYNGVLGVDMDGSLGIHAESFTGDMSTVPLNLVGDLSQFNLTITELRTAFQLQKLLEAEARGGTRYRELLYSLFGVVSPDSTQQVPEYLCGSRQRIGMQQVVQNSSTTDVSPQGNVGAYSLTFSDASFFKSFTEHGYIIGVSCIRTNNTYQNTCNKLWARRQKYDFYFPQLANISEQPVYKAEIMVNSAGVPAGQDPFYDSGVFGYQECWAEYRYRPSYVTGYINSNANQSLDSWTYAQDYFGFIPTLSAEWLKQGTSEIDRTLAVSSESAHQFIIDISFDLTCTRPMPLYGIPGLADHH